MINSRKRAGTNPKDSLTEQVQSRLSNSSFLESSIHQSLLQELGLSDNLAFLQEHGENAIYKTISSRYDTNVTYTFAGPLLISIYKETDIFSQFAIDKREDYSTNNSSLPPHLYSISMKSYFQLKDTNQNQVVSLLGLSGSGKTFSAIHLIDHLIYLSNNTEHNIQTKLHKEFFDSIHAGIQALHIMGSVMTEENKESTCCGMVSVLHFDSENRVAGANIRAKLLDTTLPSTNGRSFDILHALLTNTKPTLQNLGLVSHNSRLLSFTSPADINQKVHDSEILKRFLQNLGNLGLVRKDINHLVELLAAVIHLYDINYAPTSFVRAGQRETTQYLPRHRVSVQKICKLLGTTEEKFNEAFADSNSKSDAESKVADMGRYLYGLAFDWLVIKINKQLDLKAKEIIKNRITYEMKTCSSLSLPKQREKLRSLNDNCHKLKTISIVDFPGFRNNFSLGSFCSNLAFECLNFYASNSYMSLLASLAGEKVSMKFLEVPKSRYLVDFSLARDFGLLPNLPTADFDKYWKAFKQTVIQEENICENVIEITSKTTFLMNYTWGEVEYDVNLLRKEACESYSPISNYQFLSKCSHPIISNMTKIVFRKDDSSSVYYDFAQNIRHSLSYLLGPLGDDQSFVVYCVKPKNSRLELQECISLFRSTLVIPTLLWEWYGYPNWISKTNIVQEISPSFSLDFEASHNFIDSFLKKLLKTEDYIVGLNYVMLKSEDMDSLYEYINKFNDQTEKKILLEASFADMNNSFEEKLLKSPGKKCPVDTSSCFSFRIIGDRVETNGPCMHDYLDKLYTVEDMSFERSSIQKTHKKNSRSSSTSLQSKENIIRISSCKDFLTLANSTSNFQLFDYQDCLKEIITIQSIWKGIKGRVYYEALLKLWRNARTIQRIYRGYLSRKQYFHVKIYRKAAIMIQRNFRDLQVRRDKAARRIQNWYIERTRKRFLQNNKYKPNFDMKSSITNSDQRSPPSTDFLMFHTARRKLLRSHTSSTGSQDELLFVPSILSNSREMAHNRHIRQGSQNLPVEERLKIQEKIRKSKIDEHRKRREEEEYKDITHSPVINTSRYYDKDFYERQAIKTQEIKMKREMLTLQHQAKINEGLTFKPTINSSKEKSTYKTVDKLLNWAAIKQKEKEIAIKAKNDEESKITEKFKLSKTSERLAKNRNLKRQNSISVNQQIQETLQAYWPNKK